MVNEQMRGALIAVGYSPELVERLVVELENCDFARFAPGADADDKMTAALERSAVILNEMEAGNAS
jgi:hypothetical protein